jgi:putative MATE family efflux protein
VAAIGWWGSPRLFSALLEDPEVAGLGGEYLSLVALLAPLFYVGFVVDAAYRSCGDSRTPMLVLFVGTFLNVALDPLLILGLGPFPRLGVRGAAVATIVAQVSVVGIFAALAAAGRFPLRLRRDGAGPLVRREDLATVLRIGAPWALTGILFSVVYLFLSRVAGRFGAGALAALGIVNRMESISYLTAGAIGMAVSSMVGQNVGARLPDRAAAAADRGAWIVTATSGLVTVAFLAAPEPIVGAFTKDPVAIREAVSFLRIVAISQTVMCWEIVYNGAFIGVGMTMPPTLVSVTTSVARIPLAWWTAIVAGAGTAGLWWTITLTCIVRGIWTSWWFRRGTWRRAASRRHPLPPPDVLGPQTPEG